jgi:peptide/nickel transport system ATP-binding protein
MPAILQARDLSVTYRLQDGREHPAVTGVSFEISRGEIVGLMGESGCGKSTTALALLGLLPPAQAHVSGSALFRAQNLLALGEPALEKIRGSQISLVFQEPEISLSPVMRAGDQVSEVIRAHRNWSRRRSANEAQTTLARVGLADPRVFAAYPHQLSGGQRQRVVLAQALACQPALLIADEPTASLDARSQAGFLALLGTLRAQLGLAVLLISHSPEVQASVADRLLVMREGQIVEEGPFDALYRSPSHPYTQSLLCPRPAPRGIRDEGGESSGVESAVGNEDREFANIT